MTPTSAGATPPNRRLYRPDVEEYVGVVDPRGAVRTVHTTRFLAVTVLVAALALVAATK